MAAPKSGTRERILNAAEQLFATQGYDGTSTREIVAKSGDTIGSVNYHFGSKQVLLNEVIKRRWEIIAVARREAYDAQREKHAGAPPIDAIVAAIVIPYLEKAINGGKGWRSYILLMARLLYSLEVYDENLRELTEPSAREYIGWMQASLPTASLENIGYAYQFMMGSMVQSGGGTGIDRLHRITGGACNSKNFDAVGGQLVRFVTAGIKAICSDG